MCANRPIGIACETCGETDNVEFRPDEWAEHEYEDYTPRWMCNRCRGRALGLIHDVENLREDLWNLDHDEGDVC